MKTSLSRRTALRWAVWLAAAAVLGAVFLLPAMACWLGVGTEGKNRKVVL